ncbi:MAG: LapA family protein [Rhodocyclaceae bacterium]|nr:LapA family protein [Rhodocyclaceae bacterium]
MRSVLLTILAVLGGVFAIQNVAPVPITFVVWHAETYLAVAILGALLLGFLIGAITVLPWGIRARKDAKGAHKRLAALEARTGTPGAPSPTTSGSVADGSD